MDRNKVIDQACSLFTRLGTQTVSTQDIAVSCGISKRTLYELFQSKDLLIEEVVESLIEKCQRLLSGKDRFQDPLAQMHQLVYCSSKITEFFPTIFFCSLKRYYHGAFSKLSRLIEDELAGGLVQVLEQGKAQKIFGSDLDSRMVIEFYCWQLKSAMGDVTIPAESKDQIHDRINDFFLRGITVGTNLTQGHTILPEGAGTTVNSCHGP